MILVSGSLAYDLIMDFPGKFSDHIMPDKIHALNVSFFLGSRSQEFGGTAGNIAYNLALLGLQPTILASVGNDFAKYRAWLEQHNLDLSQIKIVAEEPTAVAHIMTDQADNQITGFYPGAMLQSAATKLIPHLNPPPSAEEGGNRINFPPSCTQGGGQVGDFAIVSPGNLDDMRALPKWYAEKNIPYIYDPGQAITGLSGEDLQAGINGAKFLICNDYEASLITHKTGLKLEHIFAKLSAIIITLGALGSRLITVSGEILIAPAKPSQLVDPTGAGDAFRAGFIHGVLQGWSLSDACRLGATVAVYTVEKHGTQTHTFTLSELQTRYELNYGVRVVSVLL